MDDSNKTHIDIDPMYERPEYKDSIMGKVSVIQNRQKPEAMTPKSLKEKAFTDNKQLDLFQAFYAQGELVDDDLSNAIELWDALPKYSISRQQMAKMRTKDGFLNSLEKSITHKGQEYKINIAPALVRDENGVEKAYYPSAKEEIIEDALRKISAENDYGFFEREPYQSGARFSLSALRAELKKRGHGADYKDLIMSLDILSGSSIKISLPDGKGFAKTAYLPSLAAVSRENYIEDTTSRWHATFHPLVTQSIDKINYRQINYDQWMRLASQLSKWLYRRLCLNYTNAAIDKPYAILFSTIKRDSHLLNYSKNSDDIRKLGNCLDELKEEGILFSHDKKTRLGKNKKIEDIKYILTPSFDFIAEMKAANKRHYDAVIENQNIKNLSTAKPKK